MEHQYIKFNKARLWFDVIALVVVVGLVVLEILTISTNPTVAWVAIVGAFLISAFLAFDGDRWLFPDHIIMDIETEGISNINEFHCDPV